MPKPTKNAEFTLPLNPAFAEFRRKRGGGVKRNFIGEILANFYRNDYLEALSRVEMAKKIGEN